MLKATAFSKVLAFLPLQGVQLGVKSGNWDVQFNIQEKVLVSRQSPPRVPSAYNVFPFPSEAMLQGQEESERQLSSCVFSGCLHFFVSFSNISTLSS